MLLFCVEFWCFELYSVRSWNYPWCIDFVFWWRQVEFAIILSSRFVGDLLGPLARVFMYLSCGGTWLVCWILLMFGVVVFNEAKLDVSFPVTIVFFGLFVIPFCWDLNFYPDNRWSWAVGLGVKWLLFLVCLFIFFVNG